MGLAIILIIIRGKQASVETIILSGVIINSLFGAGIAVMQYVANNVQLASIVFWNFGEITLFNRRTDSGPDLLLSETLGL